MSNSKNKRDAGKRRGKRNQQPGKRPPGRTGPIHASFVRPDIHREIRYITQRAQAEDSRIVTLGNLVLFSTRTRDAWLLDAEDDFAICLCREGEPQPVRIIDGPDTFGIEWTADFAIDGEAFVVHERSGRVVVIHGYPTVEIAAACRGGLTSNDPGLPGPSADGDS
jgi:hypothetical protein